MKKILCVLLVAVLFVIPVIGLAASASTVAEKYILSDMMPTEDTAAQLAVEGAEVTYNKDGSVTFTLTAATATIKYTMVEGTIVHAGNAIDLSDGVGFAVVDFATLDGVVPNPIFHYTRKDKDAAGTFADLYYASMIDNNYAEYRKAYVTDEQGGTYAVWDWGTYVTSNPDKNLFDNKIHSFVDFEMTLTGLIGGEITFYTLAITNTDNVEDLDLGGIRPEPEESSDEPSSEPESSDETSSETSAATSSEEESSTATSSEETSSTNTSSTTSTNSGATSTTSNTNSTTSTANDDGGLSTGAIVGIIVAVVAVVVIVVVVVVISKKKK